MSSSYRVLWEIDIEADTPVEAARKARAAQTRPGTWATVFDVSDGIKITRVDLTETTSEVLPSVSHRPSAKGIRQRGRVPDLVDIQRIETAEHFLVTSRVKLRKAGAHHSAAAVQRALKSVQGALRHARGVYGRV